MDLNNQDWDELGRRVQRLVNQAISSQDYHSLSQAIRQTIDQAADIGGEAIRRAMDAASAPRPEPPEPSAPPPAQLYGKTGGKTAGSIVKIALGGLLCFYTGVLFLLSGIFGLVFGNVEPLSILLLGLGCGCGVWVLCSGIRNLGLIRRFKRYRGALGRKTHCALDELSGLVGKPLAFVRKDLKKLIDRGFFLQGHLDAEENTLITSDETYRYFEHSRLQLEQRRQQEAAAKAREAAAREGEDPQVREVLDRGRAFVAQIRQCNDRIPGQEISEKIDRMEGIVDRIFQRAKSNPEVVPDLKKLMDYYLPMTVKLLNAYADMDAQLVQGQTIQTAKEEIEQTLDTLNLAFEKLLDTLFQDLALDVSSDISVLNTLLAQEGLTEDGLSPKNRPLSS